MRFLTDRKRAVGNGSARGGTKHFWTHMVSSMGIQILIPLFVIVFACALGRSHGEVVEYFSRPFPAVVTALTLIVLMLHLMREVIEAVEDYMHGLAEKLTVVAVQAFTYTLIAAGLFALVRLAI